MARLSIALPVYNGANFLAEALESVLAQRFGDFELVVSDNCSKDATPDILAEFAKRDQRVRVHKTESFLPQAANVNRSVELCHTEWVKLFCHDDRLDPACLEQLWAVVESAPPTLGLVGNAESWLFENGYLHVVSNARSRSGNWSGPAYLRQMISQVSPAPLPSLTTATVRKRAWNDAGRFDARFAHFDVFLWARLLTRWDYAFVDADLSVNRIHGRQVAADARKSMRSVSDSRTFWAEFVRDFGDELGLGAVGRLRARMRPLSAAASCIAIELLCSDPVSALRLARQLPLSWAPVLPLVIARNLRAERRKIRSLEQHVPRRMVYPG